MMKLVRGKISNMLFQIYILTFSAVLPVPLIEITSKGPASKRMITGRIAGLIQRSIALSSLYKVPSFLCAPNFRENMKLMYSSIFR